MISDSGKPEVKLILTVITLIVVNIYLARWVYTEYMRITDVGKSELIAREFIQDLNDPDVFSASEPELDGVVRFYCDYCWVFTFKIETKNKDYYKFISITVDNGKASQFGRIKINEY